MSVERIAGVSGPAEYGHEFRYRLAAGFLQPGDVVVDAACGVGYGKTSLAIHNDVVYFGVDKHTGPQIIEADLEDWHPTFDFDVFVGFETIEHLKDYSGYIRAAKLARRWIIVSTPVVPTRSDNPFHHHDFAPGDLARLFSDAQWEHYQTVSQPTEVAEISVFKCR